MRSRQRIRGSTVGNQPRGSPWRELATGPRCGGDFRRIEDRDAAETRCIEARKHQRRGASKTGRCKDSVLHKPDASKAGRVRGRDVGSPGTPTVHRGSKDSHSCTGHCSDHHPARSGPGMTWCCQIHNPPSCAESSRLNEELRGAAHLIAENRGRRGLESPRTWVTAEPEPLRWDSPETGDRPVSERPGAGVAPRDGQLHYRCLRALVRQWPSLRKQ